MLKKFIFNCIDDLYTYHHNTKGKQFADETYRIRIIAPMLPYYISVMFTIAVVMDNYKISIPYFFKYNLIGYFLSLFFMFSPFYFIVRALLKIINQHTPKLIEDNHRAKSYLAYIIMFYFTGVAIAIAIPFILS